MSIGSNWAGNAGVTLLLLLVNTGLLLASLFVCRRYGDQARGFITWMKVAFVFFCGQLVFRSAASILYTLYWYDVMYGVSLANVLDIIETSFELVVKGLLIATLGSLARGILYARTSTPAKLATPGRISSIAFVVLVSILSIAFLGLGISYYVGSRSITSLHANNIWGALHIIFFILALGLLGLGGLVFTKVKTLAHLQLAARCLLVASGFFFVQCLYMLIWIGLYGGLDRSSRSRRPPSYSIIINLIFGIFTLFATLVTLFHLARGREKFISAPNTGGYPAAPGMVPVQYPVQPGVPGAPAQGYPQQYYAQPQQPGQAYAYPQGQPQPQGQPAWQPGMYYYPQQQVPGQQFPQQPQQAYAPPQAGQQPGYPPNAAPPAALVNDPTRSAPAPAGTISASSTPAPASELSDNQKRQ